MLNRNLLAKAQSNQLFVCVTVNSFNCHQDALKEFLGNEIRTFVLLTTPIQPSQSFAISFSDNYTEQLNGPFDNYTTDILRPRTDYGEI